MDVKLLSVNELSGGDRKSLSKWGVILDRATYILLAPVDQFIPAVYTCDARNAVKDHNLSKLLTGQFGSIWYRSIYRGVEYAAGVAYRGRG